ncbi:right-handed parallel beta-helix repeat-containing protein [Chitiniphilus purpureus]|uniref:Right-handed parallel beta-helix repeat-containing protein n=1 Tax=Chitiniphilus purpureus TaxID=2981137 RepID=A0ABY6DNI8_9NEIS|nr:right-handed parallel beta-helix repeat-containing protein [Chitiniphilus sp. CD1]UXY15939.1 right-handed parallel beta-helix repeat-containing protein [Chitiniphilus sp. CD1]
MHHFPCSNIGPASRRLRVIACGLTLALTVSPATGWAVDYFVSTVGNDANDGRTEDTAFATPARALKQAGAGDTLYILDRYVLQQGPLLIQMKQGTAGAPLRLRGRASRHATQPPAIECLRPLPCVQVESSRHIDIAQLNLLAGQTTQAGAMQGVFYVRNSQSVTLADNHVSGSARFAVYLDGTSSDADHALRGNHISGTRDSAIYAVGQQRLTVSGNAVSDVVQGDGIVVVGARGVDIEGNRVSNIAYPSGKEGIKVRPSQDVRIVGNEVSEVSGMGIYVMRASNVHSAERHRNVLVQRNVVYHAVTRNRGVTPCVGGGWPAAVHVAVTDGAVVEHNRVFENYGEGIVLSHVTQGLMRWNEARDNFSVNLYLNNTDTTTVERNFTYHTGLAPFQRCGAGAGGIGFANEKFRDPQGVEVGTVRLLAGLHVHNNIVLGGRFGMSYYTEDSDYYYRGGLRQSRIANNTVYGSQNGPLLSIVDDPDHRDNLIEANLWQQRPAGSGTPPLRRVPRYGFTTLANLWHGGPIGSEAGGSPDDVLADAQLTAPGAFNADGYRIAGSSPARDAARYSQPNKALWYDYFGQRRGLEAWDIGAHEYGKPVE